MQKKATELLQRLFWAGQPAGDTVVPPVPDFGSVTWLDTPADGSGKTRSLLAPRTIAPRTIAPFHPLPRRLRAHADLNRPPASARMQPLSAFFDDPSSDSDQPGHDGYEDDYERLGRLNEHFVAEMNGVSRLLNVCITRVCSQMELLTVPSASAPARPPTLTVFSRAGLRDVQEGLDAICELVKLLDSLHLEENLGTIPLAVALLNAVVSFHHALEDCLRDGDTRVLWEPCVSVSQTVLTIISDTLRVIERCSGRYDHIFLNASLFTTHRIFSAFLSKEEATLASIVDHSFGVVRPFAGLDFYRSRPDRGTSTASRESLCCSIALNFHPLMFAFDVIRSFAKVGMLSCLRVDGWT